jgi:TonB-dependent starch-binding outer membrane protein SusC
MNRSSFVRCSPGMLLAMLLAAAAGVEAQAVGTLTGTVRSSVTNQPLPGVQIQIRGLQRGTLTDTDGRFVIVNVPSGVHTVEATSIGFQRAAETVPLAPGQSLQLNFLLQESAVALEGVVVTGTGTPVERRRLSAPVDVISGAAIDQAPVTDVASLLQGRVPGAVVQAVSAQPGQAPRLNFRGVGSAFSSQTPAIYMDGVRVDNRTGIGWGTGGEETSALADILTSDIDRIEITKGGAASTLYGSEAANGVIQIFTRRGLGAPRITARIEQGLDRPETKFIQDTAFAYPDQVDEPWFEPDFVRDSFLRTGYFQNYYLGSSGSVQRTAYNVSARVQNSEGVQPENDETIYALRGHLTAEVAEPVTLDFTGNYTRSNFNRIFNGTAIADPLTAFEVGDALFMTGADTFQEAMEILFRPDVTESVNRFTFGTTASYLPTAFFSSRATVGLDYRASEQRLVEPIDFPLTTDAGRIDRYNRTYSSVTLDVTGTFSYPREGAITSDFTVGAQGFREDQSQIFATGQNFSLPGAFDFDAAADITAFERNSQVFNGGFFVQERLGFRDVLFVDAAIRFDGNSAFGTGIDLQGYPKLGFAYNISDEGFWVGGPLGGWAPELKLRAAYGETGKFPPPFERDVTFRAAPFRGESAPRFENPGNPDLGPERVASIDVGFDMGLVENRVGVNFTWYRALTTDALFRVQEQPVTGQTSQLRNVGEILNRGVELGVHLVLVRTPRFGWNLGGTYATVHNEVTSLGGEQPFFINVGPAANGRIEVGYPVGAYFVNQPADTNGDGLSDGIVRDFAYHPESGRVLGPTPTRTGAFFSDFRIANFSGNVLADWSRGNAVFDYGAAWATFNGLERVTFPTRYNTAGGIVGRYSYTEALNALLMSGEYWKLREIGLRYRVPTDVARRWGANRTAVYGSVRNVYTRVPANQALFAEDARQNLLDPELNGVSAVPAEIGGELQLGGSQSITLPPPRRFRLGIEVGL